MAYPWIVVFTEGTHSGKSAKNIWSADDIKHVVTQTQQFGAERIPITLRHPKNDLPVLGWFSKDTVKQGTYKNKSAILVQPIDAAEGVFENLSQSTFNKVSVSIKTDGVINHLGVVENPGVKDLPSLSTYQFESVEAETYESEFAYKTDFEWRIGWMLTNIKNTLLKMRENMIAQDGNTENADKTIPVDTIEALGTELPTLSDELAHLLQEKNSPTPSQQFTEAETMTLEQTQEKIVLLETENAKLKQDYSTLQASVEDDRLRATFSTYVEEQSSKHKRIAPAQKEFYTTLLMDAAKASSMQFSTGDTDKVKAIKTHIEAMPTQNYLFEDTANNGVQVNAGDMTEFDRNSIKQFNEGVR